MHYDQPTKEQKTLHTGKTVGDVQRWKMQNSKWLLKSGRNHEATMSKKKKEYVQEKLKTLKIEDRKQ